MLEPTPHELLNVARRADLEACEAAFALRYKAARREADADTRRQALNQALAALRDETRRAQAEVTGWHVPLDPERRLPELPELLASLLPTPAADGDPLDLVPAPSALDAVGDWLAELAPPPLPADDELLRQAVSRVVVERWDPWAAWAPVTGD